MIDSDGFRENVGIILMNHDQQIFWAKRVGQSSWQFPQGGINEGESATEALYRELEEEVGLTESDVTLVASTRGWLRYRLPAKLVRHDQQPVCVGQKQRWFLLQLESNATAINLLKHNSPEFDDWRWVSYWYPIREIVNFKREVYRRALKELSTQLFTRTQTQTLDPLIAHLK